MNFLPSTLIMHAHMRIVTGLMFSYHGFQKIFGLLMDSASDWIATMVRRTHRVDLRPAGVFRFSNSLGGFPGKRRNGRCLFSVSLEIPNWRGVFPDHQRRRVGRTL